MGKFVGDNALAAVGSASPIFNLLLVLFIGISVGTSVMAVSYTHLAELPWGELGVDVVLECTGFYTSKAKAQAHIDACLLYTSRCV